MINSELFSPRLKGDKNKNVEKTSATNCTEAERYGKKMKFFDFEFNSFAFTVRELSHLTWDDFAQSLFVASQEY